MNTIFRRQKSSVYSPSPLPRSHVQADSDGMDDNLDSTQVLYNHVTDRTASLEQVEYEHDSDIGSTLSIEVVLVVFIYYTPTIYKKIVNNLRVSMNLLL